MPNAFNFAASPFDCLSPDEQRLVRASVDIAYFPEGAVVLEQGMVPMFLLLPHVKLAKRLDVRGAAERGLRRLPGRFVAAWERDSPCQVTRRADVRQHGTRQFPCRLLPFAPGI